MNLRIFMHFMKNEWLTEHKTELQEMWNTQKIVKLPPLKD